METTKGGMLAALDLGSNSFHLVIAQETAGRVRILDQYSEMVRLKSVLKQDTQRLTPSLEPILDCLSRFGQLMRAASVENTRVVATSALRNAQNSEKFIQLAEQRLGHRIEIIAGREEARLIYLGVCYDLGDAPSRRLIIDIGGGSSEFILGRGFKPEILESIDVGCISIKEHYFADGRIDEKAFKRAMRHALREFAPIGNQCRKHPWEASIGTSGTIRAVEAVLRQLHSEPHITASGLSLLRTRLIEAGKAKNISLPGLDSQRRDIFAAGVAILSAAFEALSISEMTVSQGALREGVIQDLLRRRHRADIRDSTVKSLSKRWHIDTGQANRVRETAIALLAQIAQAWDIIEPEHKQLLSWAASLHEIGMEISHGGYQRHSAYLIANMDMPGFSKTDQAQLALIVNTQRQKLPQELLRAFSEQLGGQKLLRLAVVLRLAVALHRGRNNIPLPHVQAYAEIDRLKITFPRKWLAEHPLTELNLNIEKQHLLASGIALETRASNEACAELAVMPAKQAGGQT